MYTLHVEEPISLFLRLGHGLILVQINLYHSQAQPYGICNRVINLTQTHLYVDYGASPREAIYTIPKVFCMTRPRMG